MFKIPEEWRRQREMRGTLGTVSARKMGIMIIDDDNDNNMTTRDELINE